MTPRRVEVACIAALLAAFVIDLLTPQLLVAAILLDIPIVLSSLGTSPRFRRGLLIAALTSDAIAGYVNGVQDHSTWDLIGLADRALSALSIVLVGYLGGAVNENALRAGRAASQEARARRDAQVAHAIERVRASLSTELVLRAIVLEASSLLGAREVRLVGRSGEPSLIVRAGRAAVELDPQRPGPEAISLAQRAFDEQRAIAIRGDDPLGRHSLDVFGAAALLAIPLADGERRAGVFIALFETDRPLDEARAAGLAFAQQATAALAQARLFEELAERNAALEERSAVIRDLVYALSHDLRTPLAALGMTLRQARDGAYGPLPTAYLPVVAGSIVATDDLQRLADTLLLVARFESGDRRPERERVDLAPLAEQIAFELQALAAAASVTLAIATEPAVVVGDRGDLRRAITNLVANAVQHAPADGCVRVTVAVADGSATIRVADDGPGVATALRGRLFARFAPGVDRRGGGSGLGLYIVRRVAEESGGGVAYEPNVPNGSIFTIRLPIAASLELA